MCSWSCAGSSHWYRRSYRCSGHEGGLEERAGTVDGRFGDVEAVGELQVCPPDRREGVGEGEALDIWVGELSLVLVNRRLHRLPGVRSSGGGHDCFPEVGMVVVRVGLIVLLNTVLKSTFRSFDVHTWSYLVELWSSGITLKTVMNQIRISISVMADSGAFVPRSLRCQEQVWCDGFLVVDR